MDYQYLIDLNDPKNWRYPIVNREPNGNVWEEARTIHFPMGRDSLMRVTDSVFHPQPTAHCHYHQSAYEIFFWSMAPFDFYSGGKVAEVPPGCITLHRPYEPHGFGFREPTRKVGFFHRMDMPLEDGMCGALLREKRPDARKSPDFPKTGPVLPDIVRAEDPVGWRRVPWQEMDSVRCISRPLAEERFDGAVMKMLVARWETGGVKEVWAAELEKGFTAVSDPYPLKTEMLYVTEGALRFTVYDDSFVAHKACIVKLPKYGEYRIEALSDAVVYDVNGQTEWFNLFLDRASIRAADPARFADAAAMRELRERHGCAIRAVGI